MDYTSFCIILGIFFWVLAALAVVAGMAFVFVEIQYYKWNKEERQRKGIIIEIQNTIRKTLEELDREQYDDFDELDEDDSSGGN